MNVADLITAYQLKSSTIGRRLDDARHAAWWGDHLGTLTLSNLTTERIVQATEHLQHGGRAGSTVGMYLRFLRRVTAWGTSLTYLPADPCNGIPLPKEPPPPMRVLTPEEEAPLCQAVGLPYSLWVKFAIHTGLKQSEQFALRWWSVDLNRGLLRLPDERTGAMMEVSLSPEAVTILCALRREYPASPWVCPDPTDPTQPADPHNFYVSRWTRTIARLGFPPLAWKDLRHTCGVRLAQQGRSIEQIATALRQRELRQAYHYRAWQPGPIPKRPQPHHPRVPVFIDLTDDELHAFVARDTTTAPLTFGEACRLYASHGLQHRPSRVQFERIYQALYRRWVDRPLPELSRKEVRLWYMGLIRTPGHANKALSFLRRVYNWAISLDLYAGLNPAVGVDRYPAPPRERFLTPEELQRFMDGLPQLSPKPRAFFLTLLLTGARRSEVRGMRWTDVDWTTRLWKKSRTKTGTSHLVPLPVQVIEELMALPRRSEWIFPGDHGQPWSCASIQERWQLVRRRWNMKDVTLHDLRRTCASYLAMTGENLPTIQSVLNHRSLAHTSVYARLNTKVVDRALQAQADRLCRTRQGLAVLPALTQGATQ